MRQHPRTLVVVLAVLAMTAGYVTAGPAAADRETTDRLAGTTRVATAAKIAEATFDRSDTALLARAGDFPDVLAASGLAGQHTAPTLITPRETITGRVKTSLDRLDVSRVVILGGTSAVGGEVETWLDDNDYTTSREAGEDRYHTAAEVARAIGPGEVGQVDGKRTVMVAFGGRFPDALAAGPVAYHRVLPVVLSTRDRLHPAAAEAMQDVGAEHAILVGGSAALSPQVQDDIEDLDITTERVAGRDRTDTSRDVADLAVHRLGWDPSEVLLSRGDAFPDALAGAPHGGERHAPILLSRTPDTLSYDVLQWVVDHAESISVVRALGGVEAVSDQILDRLAETAVPPELTLRYTVGVRDDHGAVHADVDSFAEHADWTLTDQRGWSLDNDYRYTRVPQGEPASFHLWLASPEDVAAAASECSEHRGPGEPAPVMDQQSISTGDCRTNVWPLPFERDRARDNIATGGEEPAGDQVDVE